MSSNTEDVPATSVRRIAIDVLTSAGFIGPARTLVRKIERLRKHRYYQRLIDLYRNPYARFVESYSEFERREVTASVAEVKRRYEADREAILSTVLGICLAGVPTDKRKGQPSGSLLESALSARYASGKDTKTGKYHVDCMRGVLAALTGMERVCEWHVIGDKVGSIIDLTSVTSAYHASSTAAHGHGLSGFEADRALIVRSVLDQVIDRALAPRFFDYDYVDDIVGIIGGRYCGDRGCLSREATSFIDALCILTGGVTNCDWKDLPGYIRRCLNTEGVYVPPRGNVTEHVWAVIPDMAEEFIHLKAETNTKRFLEINREYSRRQVAQQGTWDFREVSLLRGYERDHHLLLRTLIDLIRNRELCAEDEVLLIGPRYIDEVIFFRRHLGLPKTIGLDLFESGDNLIMAGDMHDMPFESNRFKLVFCAGTLSYSYNARKVIAETARVLKRPGYVFLLDAAGRHAGPDALGRSDVVGIETLIGLFYEYQYEVLAKDAGRSLYPDRFVNEPGLVLRLNDGAQLSQGLTGNTDIVKYLRQQ